MSPYGRPSQRYFTDTKGQWCHFGFGGALSVPIALWAVSPSAALGELRERLKWCGGFHICQSGFGNIQTQNWKLHFWEKWQTRKSSIYIPSTFSKLYTAESLHPHAKYLWKTQSQEHYSTICTDDGCHIGTITVSLLCPLVGRVPFLARSSSFTVMFTSAQCNTTANQHTAEHRWWLPSGSVQHHVSCPGTSFHSSSIGSSREA